jgi:hypothetical protein
MLFSKSSHFLAVHVTCALQDLVVTVELGVDILQSVELLAGLSMQQEAEKRAEGAM